MRAQLGGCLAAGYSQPTSSVAQCANYPQIFTSSSTTSARSKENYF